MDEVYEVYEVYSILIIYITFFFFLSYVNYKKDLYIKRIQLQKIRELINYTNYINNLINIKKEEHQQKVVETYIEPPEFIKLNNLLHEFLTQHVWDNVIAVGDIYRKGAYPRFKYNKNMALECYKVAAMCPDNEIAGIAQVKYIETCSENKILPDIDNKGEELPEYFGKEICNFAKEIINNTPYNSFTRPKNKNIPFITPQPVYYDINAITNEIPYTHFTLTTERRNTNNHIYKNDLQNVHDHSVSHIVKKNIDIIKEHDKHDIASTDDKENDSDINIENEVLHSIITHPNLNDSIKGNASIVLKDLNKKDKHGTFNITESQALSLIWNKINKERDNVKKTNMIEILAKQLDSGIENGHVVCSSGKISRIIGTFDGIDENLLISRPIWTIREEIATLAAKTRSNNSKNPQQEFKREVEKTYIEELRLDPNIINQIIDEYIEHLE